MAGHSGTIRTITRPLIIFATVLLVAGPAVLSTYWVGLLTQMVIFAILAMSLDILLGYTGLPSLGHAGIFGVAAYTVAVMSTTYHAGFWTCVVSGVAVGLMLSLALGLLVSHVRDVYFLMITLALGMVLWGVSYRWIPITGGDNGISGIPRLEAHAGLPVSGAVPFYYVTLLVFAVCALLMALVVSSPFGFTLRGIRENESRMRSLGFNTWLHCYMSYVDLRHVRQRGWGRVGVLQRLREPHVSGPHRLVGTVPDGYSGRTRDAHRSGARRCGDCRLEERDQRDTRSDGCSFSVRCIS